MAHIEDRWYRPTQDEFGKVVVNGRGKPVMERTERYGKGDRYRVRYLTPAGERRSKSFADKQKGDAEAFLITVESEKRRGTYVDPTAGKVLFRDYAEQWMRGQTFDESTRESVEYRVRKHLYPMLGDRPLSKINPGLIRDWDRSLYDVLSASTRSVVFAHLRAILGAAVDDEKIVKNPCTARSVRQPRPTERRVVPWTREQVAAIRRAVPERYRLVVDLGAGCGLRQGEIFGLSPDDVDLDAGVIHVRRQVKRVRSRLVFGLPKNDRDRHVPLPSMIARRIEDHIDGGRFGPTSITLPWENPLTGKPTTVDLLLTTTRNGALNRSTFDSKMWHPALALAGIERSRATGVHALRHFYASALLDAGENIKSLSSYLGHHDPGFTLRVYTHLMPSSEDRARRAIDSVLGGDE
ncbi:tyrosine-type recombinase/integrase [Actinocatenispora sera]|uniref:Site-specific recombinase XerD n=1 Tax=Actinocatenispora sera TaxID=390989 RepID=A0A810L5I3_9ACTN|nr:site-specific integrase [Actinocatenispora sera]BCJ29626.1 hypothetical protein Asera_37340 [Actinocatenispora sera]BCJ29646.1 hypothetical protein Asera_37540 [Actinocatenispora sera]BCJ29686.1 hypothetical protein Asera_37940 [Actinocatenispora sera]